AQGRRRRRGLQPPGLLAARRILRGALSPPARRAGDQARAGGAAAGDRRAGPGGPRGPRPLHADPLRRPVRQAGGRGNQHPPLVPAELQGRQALPPGARAGRQADRRHRTLRQPGARRGSDHRAGGHPRGPHVRPGRARRRRPGRGVPRARACRPVALRAARTAQRRPHGRLPMTISVFDLFTIGIGPSSSHTVGPMRAALRFATGVADAGLLADTTAVRAEMFGSLGATGHGHGSAGAVLLGLCGETPEGVDPRAVEGRLAAVRESGRLPLLGRHEVAFDERTDLVLHRRRSLPAHPNGMRFVAFAAGGAPLWERTYYSVGGGFVVDASAEGVLRVATDDTPVRYPFRTGAELLDHCARTGLPVSAVMLANERSWRAEAE